MEDSSKKQSERISISKKLRFEVFKRDKFTCQYCGKHAPTVILEIDHIKPVSKNGTNNILNLITSCFDCNRGKTNIKLDDNSVITKQNKQLELLQERKDQIELMFEWRDELNKLDETVIDMVIDYLENKIENFSLNDTGMKKISVLTKKWGLAEILEAIDISARKYLKYDIDGNLTQTSAEEFFDKIGGIIFNKNRPPIEQKLSYIKGVCRNNFNYWDNKRGSTILHYYVRALKEYGYSEERILDDLEKELMPRTKDAENWSEWRTMVEKWTEDINAREKQEVAEEIHGISKEELEVCPTLPLEKWAEDTQAWETQEAVEEIYGISEKKLEVCATSLFEKQKDILPALTYIGKVFKKIDQLVLLKLVDTTVQHYLTALINYYKQQDEKKYKPRLTTSCYESGLFSIYGPIDNMLTFYLVNSVNVILQEYFEVLEAYNNENAKHKHFENILEKYRSLGQNRDWTSRP